MDGQESDLGSVELEGGQGSHLTIVNGIAMMDGINYIFSAGNE